jgi:hypothetical protein
MSILASQPLHHIYFEEHRPRRHLSGKAPVRMLGVCGTRHRALAFELNVPSYHFGHQSPCFRQGLLVPLRWSSHETAFRAGIPTMPILTMRDASSFRQHKDDKSLQTAYSQKQHRRQSPLFSKHLLGIQLTMLGGTQLEQYEYRREMLCGQTRPARELKLSTRRVEMAPPSGAGLRFHLKFRILPSSDVFCSSRVSRTRDRRFDFPCTFC